MAKNRETALKVSYAGLDSQTNHHNRNCWANSILMFFRNPHRPRLITFYEFAVGDTKILKRLFDKWNPVPKI